MNMTKSKQKTKFQNLWKLKIKIDFFSKASKFILREWECWEKERMERGKYDYKWKKIGTKKGLARLVVQIGAKAVNFSALLQCRLVNAPLNSCLKPSGNQSFQSFHLWSFFSCPNLSFSQHSQWLFGTLFFVWGLVKRLPKIVEPTPKPQNPRKMGVEPPKPLTGSGVDSLKKIIIKN
jgi:hypothetical protein